MTAPPYNKIMKKSALFTNFTNQEFIGWWDGKSRKYPPGKSEWMPDYLAQHFALGLTNQELIRVDKRGNPIYKDGEKFTSPKFPEQVPLFMKLFNQAYKPEESEEEEIGDNNNDIESLIDSVNKNKEVDRLKSSKNQDPTKPQVIIPPDFDEDDESEESFKGKPVDKTLKDK